MRRYIYVIDQVINASIRNDKIYFHVILKSLDVFYTTKYYKPKENEIIVEKLFHEYSFIVICENFMYHCTRIIRDFFIRYLSTKIQENLLSFGLSKQETYISSDKMLSDIKKQINIYKINVKNIIYCFKLVDDSILYFSFKDKFIKQRLNEFLKKNVICNKMKKIKNIITRAKSFYIVNEKLFKPYNHNMPSYNDFFQYENTL